MYHVVPGMALPAASLYDSQVLPTMLVQDGKPAEVRRSGEGVGEGVGGWCCLPPAPHAACPPCTCPPPPPQPPRPQLVVDKKDVFDLATHEKNVLLSIVPSGSAPAKVGGLVGG